MEAVQSNHDVTLKTLLDGATLPAGQSAAQDLAGALDLLFNHPNVGPFIGKQLIQFLVTSQPERRLRLPSAARPSPTTARASGETWRRW